jgi:hypothetical protein
VHDKLRREPAKLLNVPGRPLLEQDRRLPAPDRRLPLFAALGKARLVHG